MEDPFQLWDTHDGRHVDDLSGSDETILSPIYSPDGQRLAAIVMSGKLRLWETATHSVVGELKVTRLAPGAHIDFSPDGSRLLSIPPDDAPRLWDPIAAVPVGEPLAGIETAGAGSDPVAVFNQDGSRLAIAVRDKLARSGHDRAVHLWTPIDAQRVGGPLTGHRGTIFRMAFSPDASLLATVGNDGIVRLWDPINARPLPTRLTSHAQTVYRLAFSPDGRRLATASDDATVRLWEVARRE